MIDDLAKEIFITAAIDAAIKRAARKYRWINIIGIFVRFLFKLIFWLLLFTIIFVFTYMAFKYGF